MVHVPYSTCGNLYCYGANNPVRYVDPDGRVAFMAGVTVTLSCGTGLTVESGLAISKNNEGVYQIGTYQISGGGFVAGMGASATGTFSYAPFSNSLSDLSGLTETLGYSFTFGVGFGVSIGGDINIPIDGPIKNFYISVHLGGGTSGGEGHAMTTSTTTKVYGTGKSIIEAWNIAVENGLLDNITPDIIEHFKMAYTNQFNEPSPLEEIK